MEWTELGHNHCEHFVNLSYYLISTSNLKKLFTGMDVNKTQNTILGQDTKCLGNEQKHYSRISNIEKFLRGC